MKIVQFILWAGLLSLIGGCGGGGEKDKVGSLSLEVTPVALEGGVYSISALASYLNPGETNLVGTEITFDVSDRSLVAGFPTTRSTPTDGSTGINFFVNQSTVPINFFVIARTGGLEDSQVVSIPALGVLTATPSTLTFDATETSPSVKAIVVSGGVPQGGAAQYSVSSSNSALVSASIAGNTVTVTRNADTAGTSIITITDAASTSISVSVTLQ